MKLRKGWRGPQGGLQKSERRLFVQQSSLNLSDQLFELDHGGGRDVDFAISSLLVNGQFSRFHAVALFLQVVLEPFAPCCDRSSARAHHRSRMCLHDTAKRALAEAPRARRSPALTPQR